MRLETKVVKKCEKDHFKKKVYSTQDPPPPPSWQMPLKSSIFFWNNYLKNAFQVGRTVLTSFVWPNLMIARAYSMREITAKKWFPI